jgi:hypothetical protein
MKVFFVSLIIFSMFSFMLGYAQDNSEKDNVETVATRFLNSASNLVSISSDLIANESLDKTKEMYLSMAYSYDSTGATNAMMLLPANKMKSMSSAEVWDYHNKVSATMEKSGKSIEWNLVNNEIKNNVAFVTYKAKDREQKVMQLKKEDNKWKVVLSFGSIF